MVREDEAGYFRIPIRITKEDLLRIEKVAVANDVVVGYYLDLIIADYANELRQRAGEPIIQSPFLRSDDTWRAVRPRLLGEKR